MKWPQEQLPRYEMMAAQARVTCGDGKEWVDSVFWGCPLRTGLWELDSQWRRAGGNKPTQGTHSRTGATEGREENRIRERGRSNNQRRICFHHMEDWDHF